MLCDQSVLRGMAGFGSDLWDSPKKTLRRTFVTLQTLETIFVGIEGILND